VCVVCISVKIYCISTDLNFGNLLEHGIVCGDYGYHGFFIRWGHKGLTYLGFREPEVAYVKGAKKFVVWLHVMGLQLLRKPKAFKPFLALDLLTVASGPGRRCREATPEAPVRFHVRHVSSFPSYFRTPEFRNLTQYCGDYLLFRVHLASACLC